ncbi:MAG: PBP1A family penicillin-binding protein [Caulobacterales bacterium]|nr:PBP1A family penicillin-binding protein [Caulobacterales bacterium]
MSDDWSLPPYSFDPPPEKRPEPEPEPEAAKPGKKARPPKAAKPPKPPKPPKGSGKPVFDGDAVFAWIRSPGMRWVWITMLTRFITGLLAATGGGIYIWRKYLTDVPPMPDRAALFAVNRAPGIRFQDRTGVQVAVRGPRYGERITLDQLPDYVPRAFLAAEDRRFYHHGALDLQGIGRAAWINWRAGRIVQGGSTITQQIAKGLFLTPDQTARRKLQEAVMARRLYKMLSRDEILELYLNRIFFGANTYGIDGASRAYFGHPAAKMTIAEAALLASLPKAPSRLALTKNMAGALERQRLILANMRREKWITEAQYQAALADTPRLAPGAVQEEGDLGYILDYATVEAVRIAGQNSPDLVVKLTIDSRLQAAGTKIVREVMAGDGARAGATQAALLALGNDGAIRAMVGGTDFDETPFNRAVQARRQPGSTFKPFVYAAALERGVLPTDQREDSPVKFGEWAPENYGGGYSGTVTIAQALARSINTVAAKLGQEVGGSAMGELARRFGLSTIPANPDLSVALGSYEVTLLQLVSAFQVFQQGGQRRTPWIIESITTVAGESIYLRAPSATGTPVYDIAKASMMVNMMKGVIERGTGARAAFGRPAAGKTGTSQNWRDAWFVGFTPDLTAGIWIGNDDDRPMNKVAGGTLPAAIWRRFMIIAHEGLPARDFDWLMPDPIPEEEADPRNPFYSDLAGDFARTADALEPAIEPETPPVPAEPSRPELPAGEVIPY